MSLKVRVKRDACSPLRLPAALTKEMSDEGNRLIKTFLVSFFFFLRLAGYALHQAYQMEIKNASDISCQLLFLHKSPHLRMEAFSMACGYGSSRVRSLIPSIDIGSFSP